MQKKPLNTVLKNGLKNLFLSIMIMFITSAGEQRGGKGPCPPPPQLSSFPTKNIKLKNSFNFKKINEKGDLL